MVIVAGALVAGAALYFPGGTHSQTVQADGGRTTEAVAATAGARVLPTDPQLKVEPK
jgi:hypothetical protein